MKIKTLDIKGFLSKDEYGLHIHTKLEHPSLAPNGYSIRYFDSKLLGEFILDELSKTGHRVADMSYLDWTHGRYAYLNEIFVRWYIAKKECTWDEVLKSHIESIAGSATIKELFDGYSEYTITDNWVELLFGSHDLIEEISSRIRTRDNYTGDNRFNDWEENVPSRYKYLLLKIDIKYN